SVLLSSHRPPSSTSFPYTTLFRSLDGPRTRSLSHQHGRADARHASADAPEVRAAGTGATHAHHRQHAAVLARRTGSPQGHQTAGDRKSTRLNSSHQIISYAVFCLK